MSAVWAFHKTPLPSLLLMFLHVVFFFLKCCSSLLIHPRVFVHTGSVRVCFVYVASVVFLNNARFPISKCSLRSENGDSWWGERVVLFLLGCVCLCVSKNKNTTGFFFLSTSTDGCQGWSQGAEEDEGRSLHEGSVSMVTPPPAHRYKKSPPSTIVRLSWHAGGVWRGGRGRANGAGSRRMDFNRFSG